MEALLELKQVAKGFKSADGSQRSVLGPKLSCRATASAPALNNISHNRLPKAAPSCHRHRPKARASRAAPCRRQRRKVAGVGGRWRPMPSVSRWRSWLRARQAMPSVLSRPAAPIQMASCMSFSRGWHSAGRACGLAAGRGAAQPRCSPGAQGRQAQQGGVHAGHAPLALLQAAPQGHAGGEGVEQHGGRRRDGHSPYLGRPGRAAAPGGMGQAEQPAQVEGRHLQLGAAQPAESSGMQDELAAELAPAQSFKVVWHLSRGKAQPDAPWLLDEVRAA